MAYSHEFDFERSDGEVVHVLLDDIVIHFDGNGWDEPCTFEIEDFDILWGAQGEPLTEVKFMNGGIVTRTSPVDPEDFQRFQDECWEQATDFGRTAPEPEPYYDDY